MRLFRRAFRAICKYYLSRYLERLARATPSGAQTLVLEPGGAQRPGPLRSLRVPYVQREQLDHEDLQ